MWIPSDDLIKEVVKNAPKAQLRSTEDDIFLNKPKKTKTTKKSKVELVYDRIINNPDISKTSKAHLIRNTKNGTKLNMEDLLNFEKIELFDFSDEEEPKKTKKPKTSREKSIAKKGYSNVLKARSDMVYEDDKPMVKTDLKMRKGLKNKEKEAIKKDVVNKLNKAIKGGRFINQEAYDAYKGDKSGMGININLDSDDDEIYGRGGKQSKVQPKFDRAQQDLIEQEFNRERGRELELLRDRIKGMSMRRKNQLRKIFDDMFDDEIAEYGEKLTGDDAIYWAILLDSEGVVGGRIKMKKLGKPFSKAVKKSGVKGVVKKATTETGVSKGYDTLQNLSTSTVSKGSSKTKPAQTAMQSVNPMGNKGVQDLGRSAGDLTWYYALPAAVTAGKHMYDATAASASTLLTGNPYAGKAASSYLWETMVEDEDNDLRKNQKSKTLGLIADEAGKQGAKAITAGMGVKRPRGRPKGSGNKTSKVKQRARNKDDKILDEKAFTDILNNTAYINRKLNPTVKKTKTAMKTLKNIKERDRYL